MSQKKREHIIFDRMNTLKNYGVHKNTSRKRQSKHDKKHKNERKS